MDKRTFSDQDQLMFAELSGDRNSVHVNALEARRTSFGRQIVRGVHLVLWSLETLLVKPSRLTKLRVTFAGAVGVGEAVECRVVHTDGNATTLELESRGVTCCSVDTEVADPIEGESVLSGAPPRQTPRVVEPSDVEKAKGELDLLYDHAGTEGCCARAINDCHPVRSRSCLTCPPLRYHDLY